MSHAKKLGIWMDHATGHLIEFTDDPTEIKIIASKFTLEEKELTLHLGERRMNTKERFLRKEFYKQLGDVIHNYEAVVLFGPTDAKTELHNILMRDQRFAKIQIDVRPGDKMTENQQRAFVKHHFTARSHVMNILRVGIIGLLFFSCSPAYVTTIPNRQYEVRSASPYAGAVWVDGNWNYRRNVYANGYWARPRTGRVHYPGQWNQGRGGYVWHSAHWR
jgi:hypothetical protein